MYKKTIHIFLAAIISISLLSTVSVSAYTKEAEALDTEEKADIIDIEEEVVSKEEPNLIESEDEYRLFLSFAGDKKESNDWEYKYYGGKAPSDIIVSETTIKSGETKEVELTFSEPVLYTWMLSPVIIADNICEADFSVKCFIDDVEIPVKNTGYNWRYEAVGDYSDTESISIGGGYNEWTYRSIGNSPSGFTHVKYEVTANSILVDKDKLNVDSKEDSYASVDKMGTYNAYLGFQTPSYSFRNSWQATYGLNYKDANNNTYFNQVTGWFGKNPVRKPGIFTDTIISGNGVYEVSVKGLSFDEEEFLDKDSMNLLFISTDIPYTDEITVSDLVLTIDGNTVEIKEPGYMINQEFTDYLNFLIQNDEVSYASKYSIPMKEISVSFRIDGFDYDLVVEPEAESEEEIEIIKEEYEPMVRNPVGGITSIVVSLIFLSILIIVIIVLQKKNMIGDIKVKEEKNIE